MNSIILYLILLFYSSSSTTFLFLDYWSREPVSEPFIQSEIDLALRVQTSEVSEVSYA